jgi:putative transposase
MPRQPRLVLPDVAVHVIQRGNDRQACFRQDSDYLLYLLHLRELSSRAGCAIHAYCLMTNHVHVLLTPRDADGCTVLMRDLGQRYVQYFNRRYGRTGTLWEGRYRSCLVESAQYVLACYRYIELNPVRAGLASHPLDYPWSSHAANVASRQDSLVSPHFEYLSLGSDSATRRIAYVGLFEDELETGFLSSIRDATNSGFPLVTDSFKSGLAARLGRRLEPGRPGRQGKSGSDPDFSEGGVS